MDIDGYSKTFAFIQEGRFTGDPFLSFLVVIGYMVTHKRIFYFPYLFIYI